MAKDIILKADNVSKQYRLGLVGTGTLSHDLNRWWHKIRGKEDPYLIVGDTNDRASSGKSDYVWALKNINFEVEKGEVLGIIGKNGAGKSTLLKILSKVTGPTTGEIKTKGRIASLLEVGTGFHPELTGRENIYLNGAILGMTKKEVTSKIDEIVEFSGCQRYVDTPVKRYSSGMKVRLAFAVAAHLEPEILVVDEVLAVGDVEFQKKAIGKMQEISDGQGRTVLFVSHNMTAVKNLCSKGIVLDKGEVVFKGTSDQAVNYYIKQSKDNLSDQFIDAVGNNKVWVSKMFLEGSNKDAFVTQGEQMKIVTEISSKSEYIDKMNLSIGIYDDLANKLIHLSTEHVNKSIDLKNKVVIECLIPRVALTEGDYYMNIYIYQKEETLYHKQEIIGFSVVTGDFYNTGRTPERLESKFLIDCDWKVS